VSQRGQRIRDLVRKGEEDAVRREVDGKRVGRALPPQLQPLAPELGQFWLRQLAFEEARALRRDNPALADAIPTPLAFYFPTLAGVLTGPLTTFQLNELTSHLVQPGAGLRWALTMLLCVGGSLAMLGFMLRRQSVLEKWTLVRRAWLPVAGLLLLTLGAGALSWYLQEGADGAAPVRSSLLWGALSLFQGVFLGVLTQDKLNAER
jgi:hypothetical protein